MIEDKDYIMRLTHEVVRTLIRPPGGEQGGTQ